MAKKKVKEKEMDTYLNYIINVSGDLKVKCKTFMSGTPPPPPKPPGGNG